MQDVIENRIITKRRHMNYLGIAGPGISLKEA